MTVVLAIRCADGLVLASDGQLTADTPGQPTRGASRKLFDIAGRVAWGGAGSAGLLQTTHETLSELRIDSEDAPALRRRIAQSVIPIQQQALRDYVPQPGTEPPDLSCLFCWCDEAGPRILEIPRTGGDHQFHELFAAIGTGEIFARSAIASLARLDLLRLDLERAKMVAYRAIADAIDLAAVYLGPPIQMYTVSRNGAAPMPGEEIEGALADCVDLWKARQLEALGPLAEEPLPTTGSRPGDRSAGAANGIQPISIIAERIGDDGAGEKRAGSPRRGTSASDGRGRE